MISDAELLELEKLMREEEIYQRREGLKNITENTPKNYAFIYNSAMNQKYEGEKLISGYKGIVLEGSARCFAKGTLVVSSDGNIPIEEIKPGDKVKTPNGFRKVNQTFRLKNTKRTVKINLKNGHSIICTEDHKFFYKGSWVEIKHLLSLVNEKNTEF